MKGRPAGMAPEVDGHMTVTGAPEGLRPGDLIRVRITRTYPYTLVGRWHETL